MDFDGVICDSAVETGVTGWKAAARIWDDMSEPLPSNEMIDQFRKVRPIIETGYESILVMRMLYEGEKIDTIFNLFEQKKREFIEKSNKDVDFLKKLFGETRDLWIQDSLEDWTGMNPLFPGAAEKLKSLDKKGKWYVVTTKQERFVAQILKTNNIHLPGERIYGLDRNRSKVEILIELQDRHPEKTLYFIEDRLPTLLNVLRNEKLGKIRLFFANWGYNTAQDKLEAEKYPIVMQDLEHFLQ